MRKYEVSKKGITKDFSEIDVFLMKKVKWKFFLKKIIQKFLFEKSFPSPKLGARSPPI